MQQGLPEYIPVPDALRGKYQCYTHADLTSLRANGCDGADQSAATQPCHATETAAERFGAATLGPPISGAIERYGYTVQWTRYARIERAPASGAIGLGRLGDDVQRLAPGQPYRWP